MVHQQRNNILALRLIGLARLNSGMLMIKRKLRVCCVRLKVILERQIESKRSFIANIKKEFGLEIKKKESLLKELTKKSKSQLISKIHRTIRATFSFRKKLGCLMRLY